MTKNIVQQLTEELNSQTERANQLEKQNKGLRAVLEKTGEELRQLGIISQQCKDCGRMLVPVVVYLHPEEKAELDWLVQDRKQHHHAILSRLISLEHTKRQKAAASRTRKPKT